MVKTYHTYECDMCFRKSGELRDVKDASKPFPRISYMRINLEEPVVFDLCPSCYATIRWGFINNLLREDLKFEEAQADQDEDGNVFYKFVDKTEELKEMKKYNSIMNN